ncbi:MAG TPA: lysylphosphatidylglycerol synthase transmembrane domain-containing protein [Actinophytocola sp.]|uniref:lysylphosphatidylglycerol synthase transmembrane domain-containing protein n=1 Tax=Actinophytocola sp. TaxID=1872138 RepID=UPI002F953512
MRGKAERHRTLTVLRAAVVIALLVVAVLTLRDKLPSLTDVTAALGTADAGWLAVAAGAEMISMAMFARQQRRLLIAFGVHMTRHRSLALAYSRSAIAISLPAGSAISAAYAFKQFRTGGASRRTAATVMVLSGILSLVALALLYATGALATVAVRLGDAWRAHPALTQVSAVVTLGLLIFVGLLAWQSSWQIHPAHPRPHASPLARIESRWPRAATALRPVIEAVANSRAVPGRHWGLALAAAIANWLTDLICLYASARAFSLPVDIATLAAVYLTVQIVRQIPLTPGGIGVIEISLLAGLVSAGAGEAAAAATVLVYRLLSCWLIIPVGMLAWLLLRRPPSGDELVERVPETVPELTAGGVVTGQVAEPRSSA